MKTLKTILIENQGRSYNNDVTSKLDLLIKLTLFICISLSGIFSTSAQEIENTTRYYMQVENFSSANGHGSFYTPIISATKGRNTIGIGPMTQKRSMETRGVKFLYQRNLTGDAPSYKRVDYIKERDILQFNFIAYIQYNNQLPLCYQTVVVENLSPAENNVDWNKARLSTIEAGSGFQLQLNLSNNVLFKASIGGSFYYHTKFIDRMYHQKMSPGLYLGTGIALRIR